MKKLTIKLRVTLWFTLMMVFLVTAVLLFLVVAGVRTVTAHSKDILGQIVRETCEAIEIQGNSLDFQVDMDYLDRGVYLTFYDGDGAYLSGKMPRDLTDAPPLSDGQFQTAPGEHDSWYLYDAYRPFPASNRSVWVRGALSVSGETGAFTTLLWLAFIFLPALVILAALAGYALVAQAFFPIRTMTESVEQIVDGADLTKRIHLGQGGDDEIYHLAATFDSMLARLQASFERESQFASDVSHELRTPTAVMISQCEYALEHAETLEEAKSALGTVLRQAERMSALVGQLLLLSRAGRGQLNREAINLSELAELVAAQMEESAAQKGITVRTEIQPDLVLEGDETMLMRLLLNLMENGVKYGREGGTLTLSLRRKEGFAVGTVTDDGIGIALENLPKIWHRLYQVDPARSSGGIGLGLPMVRYIAEAHGGTVQVESTLGKGSTFTFTLPIAA